MTPTLLRTLAILVAFLTTAAHSKTRVIVLPPDAALNGAVLVNHMAEAVSALPPGDQLLVYTAQPVAQIAAIARPSDPKMNNARIKAALAAKFKPVIDHLTAAPAITAADHPGNLMVPALIDELGRNLFPSLPKRKADVLLIGSLLYVDRRDGRTAMTERYIPSDGTLRAPRSDWVFSIAGAQERLSNVTIHFCETHAAADYESAEHQHRVERFWSLYTTGQSGLVGTFSADLGTCFRRFNAGEASGQTIYQASRDSKAEMLRVSAHVPAALPASYENPGQWFLREDVMISKTAPSASKGIAWVGIKWPANCDLDLYARGESSSPWLYYGSNRTPEGRFNKDFTTGTGESQFEFVEFTREVDLGRAEAAVNLYSCDAAAPPEGILRIWFAGRVFESPFKLGTKSGNRGAMPMAGPHWIRVDLRKVVGLTKE